jgi:hypothetical protein
MRQKTETTAMTSKPDDGGEILYLYAADGRPLYGPSDAELARVEEDCFKRNLAAAMERWQAGDLTAFSAMVRLFWRRSPEAFPLQLVEMSEKLVALAMAEEEKNARSDYAMHLERWEMVVELRERHEELTRRGKANLERAQADLMAAIKAQNIEERERLFRMLPELRELAAVDYGRSLEQAQATAAEALSRTGPKNVEPRSIRESYDIIRAAGGQNATYESFLVERQRRRELRQRRGQPLDGSEE